MMASNYTAGASSLDRSMIAAGVAILARLLEPYRADPIISKRILGLFTLSITIGQVLDWLTANFGQPVQPPASADPTYTV
jgi:hypothetical protein